MKHERMIYWILLLVSHQLPLAELQLTGVPGVAPSFGLLTSGQLWSVTIKITLSNGHISNTPTVLSSPWFMVSWLSLMAITVKSLI